MMYWAARLAGRPLVLRYGAWFLLPETKLLAARTMVCHIRSFFGVFVARLLPVVRHLIGIPMGIVKMDFLRYSAFTLAGSLICVRRASVGGNCGMGMMTRNFSKAIFTTSCSGSSEHSRSSVRSTIF